jgi:hypothetical protein
MKQRYELVGRKFEVGNLAISATNADSSKLAVSPRQNAIGQQPGGRD